MMRGRLAAIATTFLVMGVGAPAAMAADNGLSPRPNRIPTTPPAATTSAPTCNSTFNVVASPNVGAGDNSLDAISGVSPSDVWAVGSSSATIGGLTATLAEHWDGSQWTVVATPAPGVNTYLLGVAAVSANDVWAVGVNQQTATSTVLPLIEHWDGSTWSLVPAPTVTRGILIAVSAVSSQDVWAVGNWRD